MKIDNIKNYISETNQESFMKLADEIYKLTIHLNGTYPGYKEWFYDKQIKGCLTPNRNIIFIKNEEGKIIALSCLKKDEEEKKICTLFVSDEYRKLGLGSLLFEESMKFLETTKPLVSFAEDKLPMFEKIVTKYNWELTEIVDGIYNDGIREFCFNGQLTNRKYREELIEILEKIRDKAKTELQDNDTIEKITIRK